MFNWRRIVRGERNDCESNGMRKDVGKGELLNRTKVQFVMPLMW